jgi:hypothetical protein
MLIIVSQIRTENRRKPLGSKRAYPDQSQKIATVVAIILQNVSRVDRFD